MGRCVWGSGGAHRFEMVGTRRMWFCTQGSHNKSDGESEPAVIKCAHPECYQGWCPDHVPTAQHIDEGRE